VISVVIPTRNRAELVVSTVRKVLDQRSADMEIVVVDDGSTDTTRQALASIHDLRLRAIREDHAGPSHARNAGARVARGDWLTFLDDDDSVCSDWLEVLAQAEDDPSVGLVVCGFRTLGGDGAVTDVPAVPLTSSLGDATARFLAGTFAVRRQAFARAGCYDPLMPHGENSDLGIRLVAACQSLALRILTDPRCPLLYEAPTPKRREAVLAAAERTLEKYPDLRARDKRLWLSMLATAGVNSARLGQNRDARRYLLRAALVLPPSVRRWVRVAIALSPRVSETIWAHENG
jgi:glycosyltransferase involved in cell wall biosynthesis